MKTRMKSILAAAAFVLGSGLAMASVTHDETKLPDQTSLAKTIRKQISFPEFAKRPNMNEDVVISFRVSEKGTLSLVNVSGKDNELKKYVEETFSEMKVSSHYAGTTVYSITIRFKFKEA